MSNIKCLAKQQSYNKGKLEIITRVYAKIRCEKINDFSEVREYFVVFSFLL